MNKVICNLCGTSYPENAEQCPICGEARTTEVTETSNQGTYTYVKGGRFSKANVKKRNRSASIEDELIAESEEEEVSEPQKSNTGLIVVMVALLLAIILVAGYIVVQFVIPSGLLKPSSAQQSEISTESTTLAPSTEPVTEAPSLACTAISLSTKSIKFDAIGAKTKLTVTPEPANTVDKPVFASSNTAVATVSSDGTVTAVAEGSAVITVTCGTVSAECTVTCTVPTEPQITIDLNRKEITFNQEGQTWLLYDGEIYPEDIIWSSDDNDVATIVLGKVTAIGEGDTTVYGIYGDQTVSCIIHCSFTEGGEAGNIGEADGTTKQTYTLFNPYGYADDVTIYVGEQFPLMLVDENENEISGAQWAIEDDTICTYTDGTVEAIGLGTTEVTATYEGTTYTCVVRVIEE